MKRWATNCFRPTNVLTIKRLRILHSIVWCLWLSTQTALAQPKPTPTTAFDFAGFQERTALLPYATIYETPQEFPVAEVARRIANHQLPVAPHKASQGFSDNFYWVHFKIDWTKAQGQQLLLELNNPHVDNVMLYETTKQGFHIIGYGGDRNQTFQHRVYTNRRYIMPLWAQDQPTDYYLMVDKRNASVSFPLWLWNSKVFEVKEAKENTYFAGFFALIFLMALGAIAVGMSIRKKLFVYYGMYAALMGLYLFTALGFSYQYLYPNAAAFNNYSRVLLCVLIALSGTRFIRTLLYIDSLSPWVRQTFKWLNGTLLMLLGAWIFLIGLHQGFTIWLLNIMYLIFFVYFILALYSGFKAFKTYRFNAVVFLIAFSMVIMGVSAYIAVEYGWIRETVFWVNPILMGSGIEIIVLSLAMLYKHIALVKEKERLSKQTQILSVRNQTLQNMALKLKQRVQNTNAPQHVVLRSKAVLKLEDIMYVASDGPYLEYYLAIKQKPELDRHTIKWVLTQLPTSQFVQIHRSYIVNVNYIKILKANEVILENGTILRISRTFKANLHTTQTEPLA